MSLANVLTDDDIKVDQLDFDIPCEYPACDTASVWIRKCLRCGDPTFYCVEHHDGLMKHLSKIALHIALIGCTNCHKSARTFDELMIWIRLRGTE